MKLDLLFIYLNLAYIDYCSAVGVILFGVVWVLCIGD